MGSKLRQTPLVSWAYTQFGPHMQSSGHAGKLFRVMLQSLKHPMPRHAVPLAANAGVRMLVRTGAVHTTAAPVPIRFSIFRRDRRSGAWSEFMAPPDREAA